MGIRVVLVIVVIHSLDYKNYISTQKKVNTVPSAGKVSPPGRWKYIKQDQCFSFLPMSNAIQNDIS